MDMAGIMDLVIHIDEPSTVEIRRGIARVSDRCGNRKIERTMAVATLQRAVDRGQRALDRYAKGEETVIIDD